MFNISFGLTNPFYKQTKEIYYYDKPILYTKHQNLSIQIDKDNTILSFRFDWYIRRDHAGPFLEFGLLGYNIILNVYDSRHWDYVSNTWEEYDENDEGDL